LAEAPDGYEQMKPLAAEPFSHDYNLRHIEYLIGHYDKCLHQLVFIEAVDIVCDWILKDQYFMVQFPAAEGGHHHENHAFGLVVGKVFDEQTQEDNSDCTSQPDKLYIWQVISFNRYLVNNANFNVILNREVGEEGNDEDDILPILLLFH